MNYNRSTLALIALGASLFLSACISYSFTGTSIPNSVRNVYIPFFQDNSQSGLGDLSDRLNNALINRFVNQSRLSLNNDKDDADSWMEGSIQSYSNRPVSVGGDEQANLNEIQIVVRATFQFADSDEPEYSKNFTGNGTYDVLDNPVDGEIEAAEEALQQIANNAFNDAVSDW
ncbi:MAG: LptE family protein [Balneolaceae bacterium]